MCTYAAVLVDQHVIVGAQALVRAASCGRAQVRAVGACSAVATSSAARFGRVVQFNELRVGEALAVAHEPQAQRTRVRCSARARERRNVHIVQSSDRHCASVDSARDTTHDEHTLHSAIRVYHLRIERRVDSL